MKNHLYIFLGWLAVALGVVGILIPILPTTPFLVLALALFAKSSPKFHQIILNNRWVGDILKQWENSKTVSRRIKYRASLLVVVSFSISTTLLQGQLLLQLMLVSIAILCLFFIWQLKEQ